MSQFIYRWRWDLFPFLLANKFWLKDPWDEGWDANGIWDKKSEILQIRLADLYGQDIRMTTIEGVSDTEI